MAILIVRFSTEPKESFTKNGTFGPFKSNDVFNIIENYKRGAKCQISDFCLGNNTMYIIYNIFGFDKIMWYKQTI